MHTRGTELENTETVAWSQSGRLCRSIGHCAVGVYTLFKVPEHNAYHRILEEDMIGEPQALHPDIFTTVRSVGDVLGVRNLQPWHNLSASDKLIASTYMVQFTDHSLRNRQPTLTLEYDTIDRLKSKFMQVVDEQGGPLSYDQQLAVALDVSDGNIFDALFALCFASRHYARWLDSRMINGLPGLDGSDIMEEMRQWRSVLMACKTGEVEFQDPGGDTYYTWTHAFARVIFGSSTGLEDRLGKHMFAHGTTIMHTLVHTFNKQSVPSNHKVAAEYGNLIGEAILCGLQSA